ncbi:HAD family phosphatase [Candidatus Daviesbacteria bacterium]|nr:HAD family phosphatase [Candidatus Daviesbacteria bacterium]
MIKAVIYDFDDTMVDSDSLHIESWEANLKEHNVNIEGFKKWRAENLMGRSSTENAKSIVKHYGMNIDPEVFYKRKVEIFMKIAVDKLKLLPGLIKSLKLFKRAGLRLAISTGSPRKYVEAVLNKYGLTKYFDVIVTSEDITRSKPDPQMYLIASDRLELSPAECIVIEDTQAGIQSATAAGCKCIAVPNKNVTNQDYSKADLVLNSLDKITRDVIILLNN